MTDDADVLRMQWLAELRAEKAASEEEAVAAQWRAEANRLRPRRRDSRRPTRQGSRAAGVERFESALAEFLGGAAVPGDVLRIAAENWVVLVGGRLDTAREWWASGISPFDDSVWELHLKGVRPDDLGRRWQGKSLLQHFRSGVPAERCAELALRLRLGGFPKSA
ncbi:hypothetical protein [Amycolatopsis thermoflava]|uniref:hypothetical protein n=1 Tax=Amycolatopsis thermoflava TaxID=84480 RepID=UPI003EB6F0B6